MASVPLMRKSPFVLPTTPVDGYSLEWWRLSLSPSAGTWCYINHMTAKYYVNSPYIDSRISHAVPLVDDWLICKDGSPEGRACGWNRNLWSDDCFQTREEAVIIAIDRLHKRIKNAYFHISEMERLITELKA